MLVIALLTLNKSRGLVAICLSIPIWFQTNIFPENVPINKMSLQKSWKWRYLTDSLILYWQMILLDTTSNILIFPEKSPIATMSLSIDIDAPQHVILNIPSECSSTLSIVLDRTGSLFYLFWITILSLTLNIIT